MTSRHGHKEYIWFKKVAPIILTAVVLFVLLPSRTEAVFEQEKLEEIKVKLEEEKQKLGLTKKKEQQALSNLYLINRRLNATLDELNYAKSRIAQNKKRIKNINLELKTAEQKLEQKGDELRQKIVEAYKSGRINYLEILFASRSMADFINKSYYFEKAIASDIDLIKDIKDLIGQSTKAKAELESKTKEIEKYAKVVETKKKDISVQASLKRKTYEALKKRREEYERRVREMEQSSKELERLINKSVAKARKEPKSTGRMAWPARGRLVSGFGYRRHPLWGGTHFHTGIDIAAPYGVPVRAADSGEVIFSGWWDGFGKSVVINHGRSITTVYGHLSRLYVRSGQVIGKGQVIGLIGSSGYSTGPHLHFEVRLRGKPVNPMGWLGS